MMKIGLFQLYDHEIDAEAALLMCQEAAAKLQGLARCNGRMIEVEAHAVLRTQAHYYNGMMKKDTIAYCNVNGLSFDRRCVWAQTTRSTTARGWGEMGGSWSIAYGGQTLTNSVGTMFHEALGHNDGLQHAATTDGITVDSYGDDYRMGGGNTRWNYSAFEKVMLNLIPAPTVFSESASVRLVPTHVHPLAMHLDEHKFVTCYDDDGCEWGVSIPPTIGHADGLQGREHRDAYHVHFKIDDIITRETPARPIGTSVRFSDSITITVLPRHETLADIPGSTNVGIDDSGAWADPLVPGQGIHLIPKAGRVQVAWYTFDALGKQDWYRGFVSGNGTFRLLRMSDEVEVGFGRVRKLDDKLVFQFNTTLHGHNCFVYEPVAPIGFDDRSSAYCFVGDTNKGFTWHFFQMDSQDWAVGWWYDHSGWKMYLGSREGDSYALKGIQPDGNVFAGCHEVDEHPLGNYTLTEKDGLLAFDGRELVRIWI